jgi:hypothetical protein
MAVTRPGLGNSVTFLPAVLRECVGGDSDALLTSGWPTIRDMARVCFIRSLANRIAPPHGRDWKFCYFFPKFSPDV